MIDLEMFFWCEFEKWILGYLFTEPWPLKNEHNVKHLQWLSNIMKILRKSLIAFMSSQMFPKVLTTPLTMLQNFKRARPFYDIMHEKVIVSYFNFNLDYSVRMEVLILLLYAKL